MGGCYFAGAQAPATTMMKKGDNVRWKWGRGYAHGKVEQTFNRSVAFNIKGTEVKRKGSDENKALLIHLHNGKTALKLESEVERNEE